MQKLILIILFSFGFGVNAANTSNWEHKNISKALFTLDVINRIPQNAVTEVNNAIKKIYFYTNFRNLSGQKLKHRWIYNNKIMAEVNFAPKGNRWRVYSSKNLWKNWLGTWTVEVINANNELLLSKSFNYIQE